MPTSHFNKVGTIPSTSTAKSSPVTTNFSKGIKTYKPNDTMTSEELYLAQNARFERIGEYKTRRGFTKLCEPIGKSVLQENYRWSGYSFDANKKQFSIASIRNGIIYSLKVKMLIPDDNYGIFEAKIYNNEDKLIAKSCVNIKASISEQEVEFVFIDAPEIKQNENITMKIGLQHNEDRGFKLAVLGNDVIYQLYTAEAGYIPNVFEANINGDKTILFPFITKNKSELYRMTVDGSVVKIRDFPAGIKNVRFNQNLNKIRYVDGKESVNLLDPVNWSNSVIPTVDAQTDTDLKAKLSNIMDGQEDNLIYFDAEVNTKAIWSYPYGTFLKSKPINSYDKFDRDFYQNFPAIQTGDPLTAMFKLGGVIYIQTRNHKYQMFSQTADTWTQQESNAQGGTFSQESVVCDSNYAYFANDKGIYIFDGASESSLTESSIQNVYDSIPDKEKIVVDIYNNRLYVFYPSNKGGANDSCLVYNLNLRLWESFDTNTYVASTSGRRNTSNRLICGHSKIGMLMLAEDLSNDYNDLGRAIDFDINTGYQHFGSPSQLHRITKWRPEFATSQKPYTVECGYALDYSDDVKYAFSVDLKNKANIKMNYVWDNAREYAGIVKTKLTTIPKVHGEFKRCQIRYQHHAAFEPVNFKSHTLTVQTQRIR
jgi:hypothetical protein